MKHTSINSKALNFLGVAICMLLLTACSSGAGSGASFNANACISDENCLSGLKCVSGVCLEASGEKCTSFADCTGTDFCSEGVCIKADDCLISDSDCEGGFICTSYEREGVNYRACYPPECTVTQNNCKEGEKCLDKICVDEKFCPYDGFCLPQERCVDHVCTHHGEGRCWSDEDCSEGNICHNAIEQPYEGYTLGECGPLCESHDECKAGQMCAFQDDKRCRNKKCSTAEDCTYNSDSCVNNLCLIDGRCFSDSDCAERSKCVDGDCLSRFSEDILHRVDEKIPDEARDVGSDDREIKKINTEDKEITKINVSEQIPDIPHSSD